MGVQGLGFRGLGGNLVNFKISLMVSIEVPIHTYFSGAQLMIFQQPAPDSFYHHQISCCSDSDLFPLNSCIPLMILSSFAVVTITKNPSKCKATNAQNPAGNIGSDSGPRPQTLRHSPILAMTSMLLLFLSSCDCDSLFVCS